MTDRDAAAVVAAFQAGDHLAIKRLGWWDGWEALNTGWAPRQPALSAAEMVPYAKRLGGFDPALVVEALEAHASEWRPSPMQIRGWLNEAAVDGPRARANTGRGRDFTNEEPALRAAAAALAAGAKVCPHGFHSSRFKADSSWVLRCRDCAGIEQGQAYAAEDAGLLEVAA